MTKLNYSSESDKMKNKNPEFIQPPIHIIENEPFSFEAIFFMMSIGLLILFILVVAK